MTRTLWAAPHIHLVLVDDDMVVLDTETDCYHCILDAGHWLTVHPDGRVDVADEDAVAELQAAGFCMATPPTAPRRPPPPATRQTVPADPAKRRRILAAGLSLFRATLAFRKRSLGQLIAPIALHPAGRETPPDIEPLVSAARAALPWVPLEGECLQRAFQMRRFLAEHGVAVTWVFGVRTWPFAAHCWLQIDDLVVADTVERVSRYTPIMAV